MLKIHEKDKGFLFPFGSKLCDQHLKIHLSQTQSIEETKDDSIRNFDKEFELEEIYIAEKNLENSISVADNIAEQTSPIASLKHRRVDNIDETTKG